MRKHFSVKAIKLLWIDYLYLWHALAFSMAMLGVNGGWTLFCLISLCVGASVCKKLNRGYRLADILVVIFVLYNLLTYLFNFDYPFELYAQSIRDQVLPISFYFVARSKQLSNNHLVDNMIYITFVFYLIGLILFFFPPEWYLSHKLASIGEDVGGNMLYEMTRMSSVWGHSYFVGYSSLFVIMYLMIQRYFHHKRYRFDNSILVVSFISIIFAQQRVSIAFLLLFLILFIVYSVIHKKLKLESAMIGIMGFLLIGYIFFHIIFSYMDESYIDYILNRSINSDENLVDKRIEMFDVFIETISFWGSGLGKYGHNALKFDMPSIADCDYIRLPNEIGIFGMVLFLIIVTLGGISMLKKKKLFCFELMCISFYLVAMIGATPLENATQQSFFLWYCLGRIHNGTVI